MIRQEVGADIEAKHGPAKPGEQQRSVLDYDRTKSELGWTPEVRIREGLGHTVQWFREQYEEAGT